MRPEKKLAAPTTPEPEEPASPTPAVPATPDRPARSFDLRSDLHGTDRKLAFQEIAALDPLRQGDSDESGDVEHQLAELSDDVIERFEQHGGE